MYSRNPLSMYFSEHVERILPTPHRNLDWLNHTLNQGLVGYWPLRRQFQTPSGLLAKDYSGNGNDLTINNGPVLVDDAILGRVSSWDGIDDNMRAASASVVDFATGNFTMCGNYIRTTDSGGIEYILSKRNAGGASNAGYSLTVNASDQLEAAICDGSASRLLITLTSPTIATNTRYFWGVNFIRSDNCIVYLWNLDTGAFASAQASISAQPGSVSNSQIFTLGRRSDSSTGFAPCNQAELRFYNGTKTQSELEQIMKLGLKRL